MASFKLLIALLLMVPTNWALSMTSSDSLSMSSKPSMSSSLSSSSSNTKEQESSSATVSSSSAGTAAATLGDLYRKSRQSRCARCYYDDRYGEDYERTRYNIGSGGRYSSNYPSRTYDDRPVGSNWYYQRDSSNDRYDDSRVGYGGGSSSGGGRENDRYYHPYNGYYYERNEDRYNGRNYDRYERDRYDTRYPYERSPSETRGYSYGYGYESRDRYYPSDRSNDYYRGGDRYPDRNRGSSGGGGTYDRYGQDDRYYSRYDYRNYRPWDETYRGQSGFDNSGRGYYFANERPNDYYEPPPPSSSMYGQQSRPLGPRPGSEPSTPGPTYLPRDPHEQSRPSNSHHGYPDTRPGMSSSPSSSSSSSMSGGSSASGNDYGSRPRDDVGSGSGGNGNNNGNSGGATGGGGSDNKNGYTGGSWSYVNDREKDASYKGGIRDTDNQSSPYGGGRGGGRPSLGGNYLLDRDNNNVPEASVAINPDKSGGDGQISDSPTASKLTSSSSSTSKLTEDRVTEPKDSN